MIFEKQNMTISYTGKEEAPEFMKAEVEALSKDYMKTRNKVRKSKLHAQRAMKDLQLQVVFSMWHALETLKDAGLEYTGALKSASDDLLLRISVDSASCQRWSLWMHVQFLRSGRFYVCDIP